MKDQHSSTVQYYFPQRFIIGFVLVCVAVAIAAANIFILSGIFVLGAAMVVSTRYCVDIDLNSKTYREYTWFFGLKIGEKIKFDEIQYVFINKFKTSQSMNVRVASTTVHAKDFRIFVKFTEEEKIHILTRSNYDPAIKAAKEIASKLKADLYDNTTGNRVKIN